MDRSVAHPCCQRNRPSLAASHTICLPVLLVPVAPAVLQNAPGVTGFAGTATDGTGITGGTGTTVGASTDCVSGGTGTTVVVGDGTATMVEVVGATDVDAVVVGVETGADVVVVGAMLEADTEERPGCIESCFGATNPATTNTGTDAANTHPAVLRLPMRAQRRRPRTRPMTATTTMPIQSRTRTEATTCIILIPCLMRQRNPAAKRHRPHTRTTQLTYRTPARRCYHRLVRASGADRLASTRQAHRAPQ